MSTTTIRPAGATGRAEGAATVRTMDLLLRDIGRVRPLRPQEQIDLAHQPEVGALRAAA